MMSAIIVYFFGLAVVWGLYLLGMMNFVGFILVFFLTLAVNLPKHAFSPLSIFYAYYGAWFVVAPLLAERYQNVLEQPEYTLAIAMVYTVFGLGIICIRFGEGFGLMLAEKKSESRSIGNSYLRLRIGFLYCFATLMVGLIVYSSGGLAKWVAAPGDAFLNRGGSGVYVILSHFSSIALAALSGYYAFRIGRKYPVILFVIWLLMTSPVHGSKLQIALLAVIAALPWIRTMRLITLQSVSLYVLFVGIFLLGLYFRNMSWVSTDTILPYALNYFTALENLAMSLRDFQPDLVTTFFLPFVKFQTPFGLSDPTMYYDMNHMLTDYYYPKAWEIRATEQWPVETDLYLNFMFFAGLPFVGFYLFCVGLLYGRAQKAESLGHWLAAMLMTVLLISHLRGSLINHTDFYMYPYIFVVFLMMRRLSLKEDQNGLGCKAVIS